MLETILKNRFFKPSDDLFIENIYQRPIRNISKIYDQDTFDGSHFSSSIYVISQLLRVLYEQQYLYLPRNLNDQYSNDFKDFLIIESGDSVDIPKGILVKLQAIENSTIEFYEK